MINLSDNIVEAREQIEEGKRVTSLAANPDIPTGAALTGRTAYIQFCYRMAKFDDDFAVPDAVVGQSWLNVGMSRMMHELEKRLMTDPKDMSIRTAFLDSISDTTLEENPLSEIENGIASFKIPTPGTSEDLKYLPESPQVYLDLKCAPIEGKVGDKPIISWWPCTLVEDKDAGKWFWSFIPIPVDVIEIDDIDKRRANFLSTNSFNPLEDGLKSRVYMHRDVGKDNITFWFRNWARDLQADNGRIPMDKNDKLNYTFSISIHKVIHPVLDIKKAMNDVFIKTDSNDLLKLPVEFHNDVIDYAIDAYFESMFFHNFGKYSMKQARQDAEGSQGSAGQPPMNNMAGRTLAVPPNRYRMG